MDADFPIEAQLLRLRCPCRKVAAWTGYPDRVRSIQVILANQNKPLGYMPESQLALKIMGGSRDVVYDRERRVASEADLTRCREESRAKT